MQKITLHAPLDMHLHLRDSAMLKLVGPLTSQTFSGALIMPNLVPPVTTKELLEGYEKRIKEACGEEFIPYMTLFFANYTREFLQSVKEKILAIKLYPSGITTNSESGVSDFSAIGATLEAMQELDIPLCVHGESNGFVMDREAEFMSVYASLATQYPRLKIIMEHITTKEALEMLNKYDNLYATVTLHHLEITLDDVAGGMLKPHLFCKPIAKRPEDKEALLHAALNAHPKLMFGSDSAPHPVHKKEACGCAAGVFTAPLALACLAELFEEHGKLHNLQAFVSDNARRIYGIDPYNKTITLVKEDFIVPSLYEGEGEKVVPYKNGETLKWRVMA